MPVWPMAMPSSTAIVLNSRGIPPASLMASEIRRPTLFRCNMSRQELVEGIGDGDDRLAEILAIHTGGAVEGRERPRILVHSLVLQIAFPCLPLCWLNGTRVLSRVTMWKFSETRCDSLTGWITTLAEKACGEARLRSSGLPILMILERSFWLI